MFSFSGPPAESKLMEIIIEKYCGLSFFADVPEFLVLKTKRKKLRFGTTLFTQCIAEWEVDTERTYNIIKLVLLYA